ncbi:MAG: hypothetical protein AAGA23_13455 [Pseudomonadota bacterium]
MALHDVAGLTGVVLLLAAYFMLERERLNANVWRYFALNGAGALLILLSLVQEFNLSAFVIEGFWLLISLVGLRRTLRQKAAM